MVHTQILVGAQNKVFWHSVADKFNRRFYSFVRGAGYNTHHISWDCSGTLNVGFCGEGRSTSFCQNMGTA